MSAVSGRIGTQSPRGSAGVIMGALLAVVALTIAACGGPAAAPGGSHATTSAPPASGAALMLAGDYRPQDQQQADACDGVPAVRGDQLRLLRPDTDIAAAVICTKQQQRRPGSGLWTVSVATSVPAEQLERLVRALTAPDVAPDPDGICTTMLVAVPDFVLTLPDGSRIRPGVPGDGCHPQGEVTDTLSALAEIDAASASSTPIQRIATELELATGCSDVRDAPAVWLDSDSTGAVSLPTRGEVSICRYRPETDPDEPTTRDEAVPDGAITIVSGTLTTAGTVEPDTVRELLDADASPAPGCGPRGNARRDPGGDWLDIVVTPEKHAAEESFARPTFVASLELGGCRRVVSPDTGLVGYLSEQHAEALAKLADRPAQ